jgi:hypothetical protein
MMVLLHVVAEAALLQDDRIIVEEEQETLIHLLETSVPGVASVPDMAGAAGTCAWFAMGAYGYHEDGEEPLDSRAQSKLVVNLTTGHPIS